MRLPPTTRRIMPTRKPWSLIKRRLASRDWKPQSGLAFELVHQGVIDLERLVELCSTNPARIFSLADRGTLRKGAWGDVTILDPDFEWIFDVSRSKSKSRNTPFSGRKMKGAAVATIVAAESLICIRSFRANR